MSGERREAYEVERLASLGGHPGLGSYQDQGAAGQYVLMGMLNRYRHEVKKLLAGRYQDGEVDGATLSAFDDAIAKIEEDAAAWEPPFGGIG